jgi:outer membrane usher protein FimD/PapC
VVSRFKFNCPQFHKINPRQIRTGFILMSFLGIGRVMANQPDDAAAFDLETLKSRGIDPELAAFFSQASRFLPGRKEITLYVNQTRIGTVLARFDDEGQLCFDKKLLDSARLVLPLEHTEVELETVDTRSLATETTIVNQVDVRDIQKASDEGLHKTLLKHAVGPMSTWSAKPEVAISTSSDQPSDSTCYDFKAAYPQTEVDSRPGKQEVHLIVPQEAIQPIENDVSVFSTGGAGGLLNYDVLTMQSQTGEMESNYSALDIESGLNVGDWALRSRQNWIDQDGVRSSEHLYTYAQRTFVPIQSIVQAGQLNMVSPVFAGAPITGLQMLPDSALTHHSAGGATIEGIAKGSQARVEVKQGGLLIYNTVVPAGPFLLQDIALIRGNSNVDVTIFETDGTQDTFSLPAASLHRVSLAKTGLAMALGKVRDISDMGAQEPEVFTISNDWLVGRQSKVAAGLMFSPDYTSAGWILDTEFSSETSMSLGNVVSQDKQDNKGGVQSSLTARTRLNEHLTANGSITHQSDGYRDLLDTTERDQDYPMYQDPGNPGSLNEWNNDGNADFGRTQYSANLGWTTSRMGGGNIGFVQSRSSTGDWSRTLSSSWGKSFKGASVSATLQHDMTGDEGNAVFFSVSIALGATSSIQSRVSKSGDSDTQMGATYNETVNDELNYSLSASRQGSGQGTDFAGSVSALPRYTQLNLGYSQDGQDGSSYSVGARGALALHSDGVTPSPYPIQDTFGVVSLGDVAGVKINTPNGNVWTDGAGRAVVAQIPAFDTSQIEVATETLPRNMDIDNGVRTLEAGRGSVSKFEFGVVKVRRVLLTATDQGGRPLPKGASVVEGDTFLTTVVDDGKIFLEDTSYKNLMVNLPGGKRCSLTFELAEEANESAYFEDAAAVCPVI